MSASTRECYRRMAETRPARAIRYRRSITETLAGPVHPTEAMRLDDALQGIAEGLAAANACRECGHALETTESRAKGIGPCCERKLVSA